MPLLLFAYFAVEVLAFWGVAKLIGVGWALLAVLALMVFGAFAASMSLRTTLTRAASGRSSVGRLASDSALLLAGWAMCIVPGFASSFVGLLMIFPPTRALMRGMLTARVRKNVEQMGMRVYQSAPMSRYRTTYGTFAPESPESSEGPEVIDADELEEWFRMQHPDERHDPKGER